MLCRNFFCLKSNQYFWFSSSNSWYIFVCWISLFCINFAPHFTLLKFFGKRQFPEILKLPFSPVFTRVLHEFCMYFQTTYYRPVAGGSNGTQAALPRGQTGPPTPVFPHSRADGVSGQPPALGLPDVSWNVSQNFCSKPGSSGGNEIHHSGASSFLKEFPNQPKGKRCSEP